LYFISEKKTQEEIQGLLKEGIKGIADSIEMKDQDQYIAMTKGIQIKEATDMKIMNPDEDN
jgi:hypothetical protein